MSDQESNRFSARAARYARVGANVGGVAARIAGARLLGGGSDSANAAALGAALGGLKGPIMKMAQLFATIPEALPPEYAEAFQKLQSDAPPMGAAFVKRRMQAELGPDWQSRFGSFDLHPAAAASLGQVHRATTRDGAPLACKLQYPDMSSAVEADLRQLEMLFSIHRRMSPAIDTREILKELSARVREELDYRREARHAALYRLMLRDVDAVRVPEVDTAPLDRSAAHHAVAPGRQAPRLQEGRPRNPQPHRARHVQGVVDAVYTLRRHSWRPASRQLFGSPGGWRKCAASTSSTSAASASSRPVS